MLANAVTNAGGTRACPDDVIRGDFELVRAK
jgi:hypothetical protein